MRRCVIFAVFFATLFAMPLCVTASRALEGVPTQGADDPPDEALGEAKDIGEEVERILARIVKRPDRAWVYATRIRAIAIKDKDRAAPLASLLAAQLGHENEHVRLVAVQVLLGLGTGDEAAAHEALLKVLKETKSNAILASAARVAEIFPPDKPQALARAVRGILETRKDLDAEAYTALCAADATLSEDELGLQRLRDVLTRGDPALETRAALALARLGAYTEVSGRIQTLARESGELGALARVLVESEQARQSIASLLSTGRKADNADLVTEVIRKIYSRYDGTQFDYGQDAVKLEPGNLVDNAARGMVGSLDPFCGYMTSQEMRKVNEDDSGTFVGIGAYVNKDEDDPSVRIAQPFYAADAPAYKAGLRSGDYLWEAEVDGNKRSLVGLEIEDVVKVLRGPAGTTVKLWVKRPGVDKLLEFSLARANVKVDMAPEEIMPGGIGYLRLDRFQGKASEDVLESLNNLNRQNMKALVLDLRDNPGGGLDIVQKIANYFLPKGAPFALIKGVWGLYKKPDVCSGTGPAAFPDVPIVVLINGESASGSELLSGTLQSHKRATVVGEKSFGKGIGQGRYPVTTKDMKTELSKDEGRILKCTIFNYYIMPSGVSIDRYNGVGGVTPDIEVHTPLLSSWEYYKLVELRKSETIEKWVRDRWDQHKGKFMELAEYDGYSEKNYPTYDDLYASLATPLSHERIRNELRRVVRMLAADERGRSFHQCYQVDFQLQRAIVEAGKKANIDVGAIEQYKPFLDAHASPK